MSTDNFGTIGSEATPSDRVVLIERPPGGPPQPWRRVEFDAACDGVACGLAHAGIGLGDRVAIAGVNSVRYLAAVFGAMRLGAVPVPLNIRLPADRLREILRDSGTRLLFADPRFAGLAADVVPIVSMDPRGFDAFCRPGRVRPVEPPDDLPALQLYTSGSTGSPKGVLLGHAGKLWTVRAYTPPGDPAGLRCVVAGPLYHKNAFLLTALALSAGGTAVVLPRFVARDYLAAVAEHELTVLGGVPTMYSAILAETDLLARLNPSLVRMVLVGSAPLSDALREQIIEAFPVATVSNNYGTTEAAAVFGPHPDGKPRPAGSIGAPLPGVQVRLAGDLPDQGVLHVRGPGVLLGYHGRPDLTTRTLVEGWYDTGDVVRRDADGFFHFVGRADDMFVCGGENVYPADVESVVERCPGVAAASVVGVPDERKGTVPFAFVVLVPGRHASTAEIKEHFLANGPAYAHPRYVAFLDELPMSGTGKVDKNELARLAAEQGERSTWER